MARAITATSRTRRRRRTRVGARRASTGLPSGPGRRERRYDNGVTVTMVLGGVQWPSVTALRSTGTDTVHDMGGMHGFGPVEVEPDEPVFHEEWEGRVLAMQRAMGHTRQWTIDGGRASLETLPPL